MKKLLFLFVLMVGCSFMFNPPVQSQTRVQTTVWPFGIATVTHALTGDTMITVSNNLTYVYFDSINANKTLYVTKTGTIRDGALLFIEIPVKFASNRTVAFSSTYFLRGATETLTLRKTVLLLFIYRTTTFIKANKYQID